MPTLHFLCFSLWRLLPQRSHSEVKTTWFHTMESERDSWEPLSRSVKLRPSAFTANQIQTVICESLKTWSALSSCLSLSNWSPMFRSQPLDFPLRPALCLFLSSPLLFFPLSLWRPLPGGPTWWWNTPRPSCVFTQLTWTQLLRFNRPTAGTVSPSFSCSMTSWGWTVSAELLKRKHIQQSMSGLKCLNVPDQ